MTLSEFSLLNLDKQIATLYKRGVFVGKQKKGDETIVLYQLDTFYIEIFYTKYRTYISHLRCFDSLEELTPYLSQINIDIIISCLS